MTLHPNFPKNDKTFMALWDQVDLSQWEGKAGEAPTAVKKKFTYADLATGGIRVSNTTSSSTELHRRVET